MLWKFEVYKGNDFILINKKDNSVLDLLNGKKFKGNALVAFKRNNSRSQRWNIEHLKKGKILIKNQISGRCFDYNGNAKLNGLYRIWDCNKKSKYMKNTNVSKFIETFRDFNPILGSE